MTTRQQILATSLSAAAFLVPSAQADTTWTGTSSSDYSVAGNWTNLVPDEITANNGAAIINNTVNAGPFPVYFSAGSSQGDFDIFVANGGTTTGRLDQTSGTLATGDGNWMFVGNGGSSQGTFNLADTSVTGQANLTTFGLGSGTFNAGGTNLTEGRLILGNGGTSLGTLNMNTSGSLRANNGTVGLLIGTNGGDGVINLDNGTINTRFARFGENNDGSFGNLNMSGGALTATAEIAFGYGGTSTVTQSGGAVSTATNLIIGRNRQTTTGGVGTYHLSGGTSAGAITVLGWFANSNGTANVSGTGALSSSGEFHVGRAGAGTINQTGGSVSSGSWLVIGREAGSVGNYSLSDGTVNAATGSGMTVLGSTRGASGTLAVSGGTFNTINGIRIGEAGLGGTGTATGVVNLSGTGLLNTGTGTADGTHLGVNTDTTGTVNLNGGILQTAMVKKGAGTGTFNFNGGTLKAVVNSATFMQGLTAANVLANGAVFDSNNFSVTVGQPLLDGTGGGGLTKNGTGTLTLTGTNTYTGATQVNAGTLALNGTATSSVTVGGSATFGGTGTTTGSATFDNGASLLVDLSGTALTAGSFDFAGNNPVVFTGGTLVENQTYDVVLDGGGGIAGIGNLVATSRGNFSTATGKITFTAGGAGTRTWNTTSGLWEIDGAANWLGGDQKFLNGDTVVFGNPTAPSTVTLVDSLLPADITVDNTTHPYTFSGSGSIAGTTTLTKDGAGALTLATANSYSGDTTLNEGTLNLNHASALGVSPLTILGGTLDNTSGSALVMTGDIQQSWDADVTFTGTHGLDMGLGAVSINGDGADRIVAVNANTLAVGEINAGFHNVTKQGAGKLEVGSVGVGLGASVVSGSLNVAAGTLQINRTGTNAAASGDFTAGGLTGAGTLINGAAVERWFFTRPATGSFEFAGTLANGNAGALGFNKSGDGTQVLSGANSYTGLTTVAAGQLIVSGTNSGPGTNVEIASGRLTLANTQALGLASLIRFFGVDVSTLELATDTPGTAYPIAKGTGINVALVSNRATPGAGINHTLTTPTGAGIGGGTFNITSGANVTSGEGRITFTQFGLGAGSVQTTTFNPTTANVTLGDVSKHNNNFSQTLGLGGTSADNQVTGVISNGAVLTGGNNVSVLKSGSSTWTLSGANTYTGTTTVAGGILSITQPVLADSAAVTVNTGAELNLPYVATDTVDRFFIDGVEQVAGTWGSLTSSATNKTARITGSGLLQATNGAAVGGYSGWSTFFGLTGNAGANQDNDGAENGTEYILGGSPVSGSNNPKIYSLIEDGSVDGDTTKELILTIAVPQGTPVFSVGAPSTATFEGFGIAVRGSTDLSSFPVTVTPVNPVVTGLPAAPFVQGGITYEYRSFSLGNSNGTPDKGFFQVVVTNP